MLNRNRETSKFHGMKVGLGSTRKQNSTLKQQIDSSFQPERSNLTRSMKPKWKEDSNSAALETLTKPSSRRSNFIFIKVLPKKIQRTVVRRMPKKMTIWWLDWTRAVTYHSKRRITRQETWMRQEQTIRPLRRWTRKTISKLEALRVKPSCRHTRMSTGRISKTQTKCSTTTNDDIYFLSGNQHRNFVWFASF